VRRLLPYYSPCFARVGDQFILSSSIELGRELIGIVRNEKKSNFPDAVAYRFLPNGAADYLRVYEEQLVTQNVLDRALTVDEARGEAASLLEFLRSIGPLDVNVRYDPDQFSYNFRLKGLK
jgi:hypothetical protein